MCSGDYVFHLDADEIPHETLIEQLHTILDMNDIDLVWIPRINTVEGITQEHIDKWGWKVTSKGWINYPDYQARVYKNVDKTKTSSGREKEYIDRTLYAYINLGGIDIPEQIQPNLD